MIVAITHTMGSEHKWQKYLDWLQHAEPSARCMTLSYELNNAATLENCDALMLTGGHDVDPAAYGGPLHHSKITNVDKKRDDFERNVLDIALRAEMPILGICRGLQLVTVHLGGTLVPDIEEAGYRSHKKGDEFECYHNINIEKDSLLSKITGSKQGEVNSSHHQSVATVGKGLRVTARSDDGIIEALEYEHRENKPFFLLTQWHPERLKDIQSPLSLNIVKTFLTAGSRHSNIVKGS